MKQVGGETSINGSGLTIYLQKALSIIKRWSFLNYYRRQALIGFIFILPTLIYFGIFAFGPMIKAIYLSLFNYDILSPKVWIGITNYTDLLDSKIFIESLRVTAVYAIGYCIPLWILSLILSLVLNENIRFRTFFRTLLFSPIVIPLVVLAIIWTLLYHPFGPINAVFVKPLFHVSIPWLSSKDHALFAVLLMAVWRALGYYAVIFLAGLQNIPDEYYEAAKIDGAGSVALFRNITWPLLRPTTAFVVVLSFISAIRHFDAIWIMTRGGPIEATHVLAVLIYETGWYYFKMGRASAMSVIMFVFVMILTIVQLRIFKEDQ